MITKQYIFMLFLAYALFPAAARAFSRITCTRPTCICSTVIILMNKTKNKPFCPAFFNRKRIAGI
jgi:hypothetical protein